VSAEQRGSTRRPPGDTRGDRRHRPPGPASVADAAAAGRRHVGELTTKPVEGVTSVEREDGLWRVGVEVVEDHRIPPTADVLARYEAEIDDEGALLGYHRVERYPRYRTLPRDRASAAAPEPGPPPVTEA
jgi:hypothetical protein